MDDSKEGARTTLIDEAQGGCYYFWMNRRDEEDVEDAGINMRRDMLVCFEVAAAEAVASVGVVRCLARIAYSLSASCSRFQALSLPPTRDTFSSYSILRRLLFSS